MSTTIRELIKELKKLNPNWKVRVGGTSLCIHEPSDRKGSRYGYVVIDNEGLRTRFMTSRYSVAEKRAEYAEREHRLTMPHAERMRKYK